MKQKEILVIVVTIFLTVIAWVISDIYKIHKETPTEEQIQSVHIDYVIDTAVLDDLERKTP